MVNNQAIIICIVTILYMYKILSHMQALGKSDIISGDSNGDRVDR